MQQVGTIAHASGTCTYTQVASSPTADQFTDDSGLQSLLSAASTDPSCTAVAVQFTTGFTLQGSALQWDGSAPIAFVGQSSSSTVLDGASSSSILVTTDALAAATISNLTMTNGNSTSNGGATAA